MKFLFALAVGALSLSACSLFSKPPKYLPAEPPASAEVPYACAEDFLKRSETLTVARNEPADIQPPGKKGEPLKYATRLYVEQLMEHISRLTPFNNGWSSYALRIQAPGATSISVHLNALQLPMGTEIWLCSPDGRTRQGPMREAAKGELWTPMVPGDQAWLEFLVHSRKRDEFQANVAAVMAGFR